MMKLRYLGLFCGVIALLSMLGTAHAYENKRVTVTAIADRLSSDNFTMSVTSTPIGGVMGVCPTGAVNRLGFWSFLGTGEVPMYLAVDKHTTNTFLEVDLSWSGQSSQFEIYRSDSPIDLVSPGNLYRTTTQCSDIDEDVELFDFLYYKITSQDQ